jgi:FO synthase subunit 1
MRRVTAMARYCLPDEISVQSPPNLAPVRDLLDCGVDDLGGVSPVTDDHINPEYKWPALRELEDIAEKAGVPLTERLPVHERFLEEGWLSERIESELRADTEAGRRYRERLSDGAAMRFA